MPGRYSLVPWKGVAGCFPEFDNRLSSSSPGIQESRVSEAMRTNVAGIFEDKAALGQLMIRLCLMLTSSDVVASFHGLYAGNLLDVGLPIAVCDCATKRDRNQSHRMVDGQD